ncbi:hypothetical protein PC116_g21603 [Phytophthora cactorum]|uniref:Uncharacterized protein n=1 Tax=Phytophthora cactorum TaxID=29920 RepID=A0A8T1C0I9_9STRA|nr:hypothetical protein Pcac1_g9046 [Phytophthora cactorum]KAG2886653.1 hypothetical protein PC114_g19146 [Phytophthora cactorum]KAG2912815.1 hypothetical protein PC117_g18784 [Phytophthora cactorum]KAG3000258.1 hypothetical protein PC120_g20741 [Phytophthora cactorum]KAG3142193.1 hypothetical protein C6341_g19507 [Phytophthora cactorum]
MSTIEKAALEIKRKITQRKKALASLAKFVVIPGLENDTFLAEECR